MFVDFNKVFKSKPQTQITAPAALVEYINKSLPDGVKYIAKDNGDCVITSEGDSISIGGFFFKPTKEQEKILGKNFTHQDVLDYFYNTQKPIQLTLQKDGFITLNGQEFPIDKMAYNPLNPIKYVSGTLRMYPQPFPDPFEITIGCDEYERRLLVSRVPHNSVRDIAFESSQDDSLWIKYLIDGDKHHITLNISFNLKNAKSIRDIVESTMIYNAFLDGKGILMGQSLNETIASDESKRFDNNSAIFWEKVLKIEEFLDVHFIPPQDDVDSKTVYMIEQLYQNLIKKVPTKESQIINSIDGTWNLKKDIKESIGKPVLFEFEATSQMELFGVQKKLPALLMIFNAVLADFNSNGKKQKFILSDESPKAQRYTSIMYFRNEEDLKAYKSKDYNQKTNLFKNAKKPQDYL